MGGYKIKFSSRFCLYFFCLIPFPVFFRTGRIPAFERIFAIPTQNAFLSDLALLGPVQGPQKNHINSPRGRLVIYSWPAHLLLDLLRRNCQFFGLFLYGFPFCLQILNFYFIRKISLWVYFPFLKGY